MYQRADKRVHRIGVRIFYIAVSVNRIVQNKNWLNEKVNSIEKVNSTVMTKFWYIVH